MLYDFFGMFLTIFWIGGAAVLAAVGDQRKIGGVWAFVISIFLSPFFAALIVLISKDKQTHVFEKHMFDILKAMAEKMEVINQPAAEKK